MSDTAGYTDTIFGIFHLLGYQLSPRIADIGGSRFWRVDRKADYGVLNDLASNKINVKLIAEQWDRPASARRFTEAWGGSGGGAYHGPFKPTTGQPGWRGGFRNSAASSRRSICCATSTTNNIVGAS